MFSTLARWSILGFCSAAVLHGYSGQTEGQRDTATDVAIQPSAKWQRALSEDTTALMLRQSEIPWRAFVGLSDLLSSQPLLTAFHTGEAGGWHLFGFGRIAPQGVGLSLNGRPWWEPTFGALSPELYPPEFVGAVELLKGTEAAVLGWNALGVAVNIVEPLLQSVPVASRLWYLNAAYGVGGSDGMLSLALSPTLHLVAGYRRLSSEGRFRNGWSNSWNVRLRLQWMPTPRLLFSLSELFTHWVGGQNGGIAGADSLPRWWDEVAAQPILTDFNDRLYRHDVTLMGRWCLGSSSTLVGQVWYVPVLWQRHIGQVLLDGGRDTLFGDAVWRSQQFGARLQAELGAVPNVVVGVQALWARSPELPFAWATDFREGAAYGLGRWVIAGIQATAGIRITVGNMPPLANAGFQLRGVLGAGGWWRVDAVRALRRRSGAEMVQTPEEAYLLWVEGGWRASRWEMQIGGVGQWLRNAVIANLTPYPTPQQNADALLIWGQLSYKYILRAKLGTEWSLIPSAEEAWRTFRLVAIAGVEECVGRSCVRAELRWEVLRPPALRPFPTRWMLYQEKVQPLQHSGGELCITASFRGAYLRLALRNLLGVPWYWAPYFPQPGRSALFALTWFFDD
ncbi:MAG: hypothetical protein ABDH31_07150 [Chlorobiota bacterium]